jgi:hypothetical protein
LTAKALSYLKPNVRVNKEQAWFINSTTLTLILVGRFTPPLRACLLRELQHPSKVSAFELQDFAAQDLDLILLSLISGWGWLP